MGMKLKLDEEGHAVLSDGMPVYVDEDGKDLVVDVPNLFQKITELNAENKSRREKAQELEQKLKTFDGIENLEEFRRAAEEAMEKLKNLSDKELIEAGKVEQLKSEMKQAHEQQVQKLTKSFEEAKSNYENTIQKKDGIIYKLMVSSKFAQSPFFSGENPKTNLPPEIGEAYFGHHFKVIPKNDDGDLQVVAYSNDGKEIYSRKMPGELADFDEALEMIIDNYPKKNLILRAGKSGSGSTGGGTSGGQQEEDEISRLQNQYEEATKAGDAKTAIAIKNRIYDLRNQQ